MVECPTGRFSGSAHQSSGLPLGVVLGSAIGSGLRSGAYDMAELYA